MRIVHSSIIVHYVQLVHKKCSSVKGRLQDVVNYCCPTCVQGRSDNVVKQEDLVLDGAGKLEYVDRFCYLGDMLGAGGGVEDASRNRVKCV